MSTKETIGYGAGKGIADMLINDLADFPDIVADMKEAWGDE